MIIGIDLDNTVIDYTEAFLFGARQLKLIPKEWTGKKLKLKSLVQSLSEGELQWQKLQGQVYGQWIQHAKLYAGVIRFLFRCRHRGWETVVVSHKTEFGHFDHEKISLRNSAKEFLSYGPIWGPDGERLLNDIKFEPTREQKIQVIKHLQCDVFIDDLPEILENNNFPVDCRRILFDPDKQHKKAPMEKVHSWDNVSALLLGEWNAIELNALAESCGLSPERGVKAVSGGGNSPVYKGFTISENDFAIKIYPPDSAHDRLRSEFDGLSLIHTFCTLNTPEPLSVNRSLEVAAFRWVEGKLIKNPESTDIDQAVELLSSLQQYRHQNEFETFPFASAACLSGRQIEQQLKLRVDRLLAENNERLKNFLNKEFESFVKTMLERAIALWPNQGFDMEITRNQQILSPSDFGFHNALKNVNGSIVFIDFEYFGWDDPVKLLCDFAFHPGMELSVAMKKYWFKATLKLYGEELLPRLHSSWPLYGLCWVLIILNEFRSDIWDRRRAADPSLENSRKDVQLLQLKRARQLIKFIDHSVKTQTFDFM